MVSLILLLLLFASPVEAAVCAAAHMCFPSDPVTIVGLQGRPIPNAQVTVTFPSGAAADVYQEKSAINILHVVPAAGILQFFSDPGTYLVNVSGEGLTKLFYVTVSVGSLAASISIDRTADMAIISAALGDPVPPQLFCDPAPCLISFGGDPDRNERDIYYDWTMPSYGLDVDNILFEWHSASVGNGTLFVGWKMSWCTYNTGEAFCTPVNDFNFNTTVTVTSNTRTLVSIPGTTLPGLGMWNPSNHVVFLIGRRAVDTYTSFAGFVNLRLEYKLR